MWIAFALLAAVGFGFRGILYHWTSQQQLDRNLALCGVFFTGVILCGLASLLTNQEWTLASMIGIAMGVFSFTANASLYKGFAVGKASIVAILTALPAVVVVALAHVFWGETLTPWQWTAFGVIIASVVLIRYSSDITLKNLQGAQWGLLAMLFFALNDLTSKQSTLSGADPFPTLFFMFATGSLLFWRSWRAARRRAGSAEPIPNVRGWGDRKVFVWGMGVGLTNSLGMIFILEAFARGITGLVSAVVAMNIILILAYTRFFVKIPFKRLEIAGMAFAMAGIVLLEAMG